jgi:hypothetical protein
MAPLLNETLGKRMIPRLAGARRSSTGNAQPRTLEEHAAFLMDAFDSEDIFDFNDSDDVAEFYRLYRRTKGGLQSQRKKPRGSE